MTDNIKKELRQMSPKMRKAVELVMLQILTDYKKVPQVKKLKGKKNLYRARIGVYRIIFQINKKPEILDIRKRSEATYKNL